VRLILPWTLKEVSNRLFEALLFLSKYAALKKEFSRASRAVDDRLNDVMFHKYVFVPIHFAVCQSLL
jgi:hypothetical protein